MDGWMVGECDRGGPQLWPPGVSYHDNHGHTGCEVCHQISALVIMKDND